MTTTTAYRTLFQDYLGAGLQLVLAQVQAAEPLVPDDLRRQAWHLLSYAFESDAAWPLARDLLLALAPKMEQAGFRDEWIVYLEQALHSAVLRSDQAFAAECQLHIGNLHRLRSRFDAASNWLHKSFACFEAVQNCDGQARALNELAWVDYLQHRYTDAIDKVDQALRLDAIRDLSRAMCYRVKGMVAIDLNQWHEASNFHHEALTIFEKYGDVRRTAWSWQNLGYALRGLGQYEQAIHYFNKASTLLEAVRDTHHYAVVQMNLGGTHYFLQQYTSAVACFQRALAIFHPQIDQLNLGKIYTALGLTYLELADAHRAELMFRASASHFQNIGDQAWYLNALDGLALAYLALHQPEQATTVLSEALELLSTCQDLPNYEYLLDVLTTHAIRAEAMVRI